MQADTLTVYSYVLTTCASACKYVMGEPGRRRSSHTVKINPEITVGISDKRMA